MTIIGAEEAAPAWVPAVAFAIPVLILLAVGVPAARTRRRASSARRAQGERRRDELVALGSAATIADPSGYTTSAILKALAVRPEDHGPTDDEPWDAGWAGTMLGLKSKISYATNVLEPHLYWGTRGGRQVFIRVGPDEKIQGGTTMLSNRHVRAITVVRVDAPAFAIESDQGALRITSDWTPELEAVLAPLSVSPPSWSDARITGGPDGIVAARNAIDGIENSWAYDLWLCERIADRLDLEPLPVARIGPAWKVPYGLGSRLSPIKPT